MKFKSKANIPPWILSDRSGKLTAFWLVLTHIMTEFFFGDSIPPWGKKTTFCPAQISVKEFAGLGQVQHRTLPIISIWSERVPAASQKEGNSRLLPPTCYKPRCLHPGQSTCHCSEDASKKPSSWCSPKQREWSVVAVLSDWSCSPFTAVSYWLLLHCSPSREAFAELCSVK